jgi:hypothetical protein
MAPNDGHEAKKVLALKTFHAQQSRERAIAE